MYDSFVCAIQNRRKVRTVVNSKEKGMIQRNCIPFDFHPSRKFKDRMNRYHFLDLDSPEGKPHPLSILPEQLLKLEVLEEEFDPAQYVTWNTKEKPWFIPRDWGIYS